MPTPATQAIPADMHALTPHLICAGAAAAIDFYKAAFGAVEKGRIPGPGGTLMHAAVRIGDYKYRFSDQPQGWLGGTVKLDWPMITNLRLDPFERMGLPNGANGSLNFYSFFIHEFWRFVFVQQEVARYAETFVQYPPMQRGASFNMEAVKAQIEAAMERARAGHD